MSDWPLVGKSGWLAPRKAARSVEWAWSLAAVLAVQMVETTAEMMVDLVRSTADMKAVSLVALMALHLAHLRAGL